MAIPDLSLTCYICIYRKFNGKLGESLYNNNQQNIFMIIDFSLIINRENTYICFHYKCSKGQTPHIYCIFLYSVVYTKQPANCRINIGGLISLKLPNQGAHQMYIYACVYSRL